MGGKLNLYQAARPRRALAGRDDLILHCHIKPPSPAPALSSKRPTSNPVTRNTRFPGLIGPVFSSPWRCNSGRHGFAPRLVDRLGGFSWWGFAEAVFLIVILAICAWPIVIRFWPELAGWLR